MSRRSKKGRNKGNNQHPKKEKRDYQMVDRFVDPNSGPGKIGTGDPPPLPPIQDQITIINQTLIQIFQFLESAHNRLNSIESFLSKGEGQSPQDPQEGMFTIKDGRTDGEE